jgi:hypothetical protein
MSENGALEADRELKGLLDRVFGSTPLLFIRQFLRTCRQRRKEVRIGRTRQEVRANLRQAMAQRAIGRAEVEQWLGQVEGWGRQHLYVLKAPIRPATSRLLNTGVLARFLRTRGMLQDPAPDQEPGSAHRLTGVEVDDELARIVWQSFALDFERHEELDEVRDVDEDEYEFRAFRRVPRRSGSRALFRKVDGIVLFLIDLPLGADHDALRERIRDVVNTVLSPLKALPLPLSPIVSALDEGAVAGYGPRAKRQLKVGVAPTQALFRAEGAQVEFRSTRQTTGYTESQPVREIRKAMHIKKFVGQAGKFRLSFEGQRHELHQMVVSFHAGEDRIYLFSRMDETEVLSLVDQLVPLASDV